MAGTFTKNTLITLVARAFQLLLGIGVSIIIARALGPDGKGIYALVILLPMLLMTFTNIGIGTASVYYIGQKKYSPKEIFGNNVVFSFIIGIFAILFGLIVIFFFGHKVFPGIEKGYLFLALPLVLFEIFSGFVITILLGLQKIKKFNLVSLIRSFISLFLIAIFLLGLHLGIRGAIIAQVISIFISCVVLFILVSKETAGISFRLNKAYLKDSFLYGVKTYLANLFAFLHERIDMFLLNIFLNPLAVGFYSIAVGLSEKIWLISQSAGTVLFPKVSSETDRERLKEFTPLVCRNILFITVLMSILLFFFSYWIIALLYSEKFLDSILPFQILLIGTIAISGSRILANDISGRGKPMINTYLGGAAMILNILLNILWIPKFGIIGAAWAATISYTFVFIIRLGVYSKISDNKIRNIIFIKKSDFKFYKNFIILFKNKYFNSSK